MQTKTTPPFNQNIFKLTIPSNQNVNLEIIHFKSNQYSFDYLGNQSPDYTFELLCYNPDQHALKQLIGKKACLSIQAQNNSIQYFHGIISEIIAKQNLYAADKIILSSPLYPLSLNIQQRIYHHLDLQQLITQILSNAGWHIEDFQFRLSKTYLNTEYIVQYQESDFIFLQRKCAYYGVFFTFLQNVYSAILIFCDDVSLLSNLITPITLPFCTDPSLAIDSTYIFAMKYQQQLLADNIRLHDYNDQTPELSLLLESTPQTTHSPLLTEFRFQDHYHTLEEGQFLLQLRQEALDCRRKIWCIKSICNNLQPGKIIIINHHPLSEMNGEFVIISIQHFGDQSAAYPEINHEKLHHRKLRYSNRILLISLDTTFRPIAPTPLYQENLTANITRPANSEINIDDQGRYTIKPKFDQNNISDIYPTSSPVQLVHPLIGENFGMHFPLPVGTEVLLMHINGDPERPVIMGVLPKMNSLPPVTAANKSEHILKSTSQNQLIMDDQIGAEKIIFQTPQQQNQLILDATTGQQQIKLQAATGDLAMHAGNNIVATCDSDFQQIVGNNHLINVNNLNISTENGDVNLSAGNDLQLISQKNINLNAQQEDVVLQAGNTIQVKANNSIEINVKQGNMNFQLPQGQLNINAAQGYEFVITGENGQINISQNGASIQITIDEIKLTSPTQIIFNANEIIANNVIINQPLNNEQTLTDNLILHFKDETNNTITNLNGIYHMTK